MSLWTYLVIVVGAMTLLGFTLVGRHIAMLAIGGFALVWAGISWERMATMHLIAGQEQASPLMRFGVLLVVLLICIGSGWLGYSVGRAVGRLVNSDTHPAREP